MILICSLIGFAVASHNTDVCTAFDSQSFCMDDGICSGHPQVSCDQAYELTSSDLLRPSVQRPLTPSMPVNDFNNANRMVTQYFTIGKTNIPEQFSNNEQVVSFVSKISDFESQLSNEYFLLQTNTRFLRSLIANCQRVRASLTNPDDWNEFRKFFVLSVGSVHMYFSMILRWIYSLDRQDISRRALFNNLTVYMQTWMYVHRLLFLHTPFASDIYLEILSEAATYSTSLVSTWTIPVGPLARSPPLLLPVVDTSIPLAVYDHFGILEDTPIADAVETITTAVLTDADYDSARAALFLLRNHPDVSGEILGRFCTQTRELWIDLLPVFEKWFSGISTHTSLDFLDVFRLCGRTIIDLDERISAIMPAVLGRRIEVKDYQIPKAWLPGNGIYLSKVLVGMNSISLIELKHLIFRFLIRSTNPSPEKEHRVFLSVFVRAISGMTGGEYDIEKYKTGLSSESEPENRQKHKSTLRGVGILIGQIILARDPDSFIHDALVSGRISNLYMNSRYIREGFCRVIDCLVLEAVLAVDEIPRFLHLLRSNQH